MGQLKKAQFVEEGCYAQVTSNADDFKHDYIFRKFTTGLWIGSVHPKNPDVITDFMYIPNEILETIKNAPSIIPGDGKSPQLLAEDLIDDTRLH